MNAVDDLDRLGFFGWAAPERVADLREECRRALDCEYPNRIASVEGLGRFGCADAESLSEQGMADALSDLAPLLAPRGIAVRRLPPLDVYVSVAGGEWLIADDEINAYNADGECGQIDECVLRLGTERFSLMHEHGNSWMPSSRALCAVLRKLLRRAGSDERVFALMPGENDQNILLGTEPIAHALRDARVQPLEAWPELDADPELHAFGPSDDTPIGESDFRDLQRLHREDEDIAAAMELAGMDGFPNHYSTQEIIVVPPDLGDGTASALGVAGLPRQTAHYHGLSYWLIDAGSRDAATRLVRALHNSTHASARIIAQAAPHAQLRR